MIIELNYIQETNKLQSANFWRNRFFEHVSHFNFNTITF